MLSAEALSRAKGKHPAEPEVSMAETRYMLPLNKDTDHELYHISVVSRIVDLHPQTLRTYELMGLITPARSEGNVRLYSADDIERLRRIQRLVDELGVNLAGVEVILNMRERMEQMHRDMEMLRQEMRRLRREMSV